MKASALTFILFASISVTVSATISACGSQTGSRVSRIQPEPTPRQDTGQGIDETHKDEIEAKEYRLQRFCRNAKFLDGDIRNPCFYVGTRAGVMTAFATNGAVIDPFGNTAGVKGFNERMIISSEQAHDFDTRSVQSYDIPGEDRVDLSAARQRLGAKASALVVTRDTREGTDWRQEQKESVLVLLEAQARVSRP